MNTPFGSIAVVTLAAVAYPSVLHAGSVGAAVVIDYDPGDNPTAGYTDPAVTLGQPERFTGEGVFPGVVSPFNPAFGTDEIVSIGANGSLVVQFDPPVTNDPSNPWGVDLIIFGNAGFIDAAFPAGVVGGLFGADGGTIEVSFDNVNWTLITGLDADGIMPTLGYLDAGPFDVEPGLVPSRFTRPTQPGLDMDLLGGMGFEDLLAVYDGSGGGAGVDLASSGLASIAYVRITNPGDPARTPAIEIDAFVDVTPETAGDVDHDGVVGVLDLLALLSSWGACPALPLACPADLDDDGLVGVTDLLLLLGAWGDG